MPRKPPPTITGNARDMQGHVAKFDETIAHWLTSAQDCIEHRKCDARVIRTARKIVCTIPYYVDDLDSTEKGEPVASFSLNQMAEKLGCSVATVRNGINCLVVNGYPISIAWKPKKGESGHGTIYALTMQPLSGSQPSLSGKALSLSGGLEEVMTVSEGKPQAESPSVSDTEGNQPQAESPSVSDTEETGATVNRPENVSDISILSSLYPKGTSTHTTSETEPIPTYEEFRELSTRFISAVAEGIDVHDVLSPEEIAAYQAGHKLYQSRFNSEFVGEEVV